MIKSIKNNKTIKLLGIIALIVILSRIILYLTFLIYSLINKTSYDFNSYVIAMNKYDAKWYKDIILYGYREVDWDPCKYSWAFFPLFPLIIKFFHLFIPLDPFILGMFFNSFILIFVCLFVYKYLILTRNNKVLGFSAIFLLCFGPWSMYSNELMSETLFMLFLILTLYCMRTNKLILMGLFGSLLSAARVNGIFIIFPILIYFYSINPNKGFKPKVFSIFSNSKLIFSICLIPIGIFSFMLYLQIKIHDGFGFFHVQKYGWNHHLEGIFSNIFQCLGTSYSLLAFVCISVFLIAVFLISKNRLYEAIFPTITMCAGLIYTIQSTPRYSFASLTIMFGFLDFIYSKKLLKKTPVIISIALILFIMEIELSSFLMFNKFGKLVV